VLNLADRPVVAVLGGGASGALAALALLITDADIHVVVVEPRARLGHGVAYSTTNPAHRINVPASAMSAEPGDPDQFVRWARMRGEHIDGFSFPSRGLYGSYLDDVVRSSAARSRTALTHVRGVARSVRPDGARWTVSLVEGVSVTADAVVLAVGYGEPAPPVPDGLLRDPRFVIDPWADSAFDGFAGGAVALIGTGLTAVDTALTLTARHPDARITAVSRHGLRPLDHRPGGAPADPPPTAALRPHTALGLLRSVRAEIALSVAQGGDWRDVFNRLRPDTQALWQELPLTERHRFAHRLARFWEVHRHRLAPQVSSAVGELEGRGALTFLAGRPLAIEPTPAALRVELGLLAGGRHAFDAQMVVNCTGVSANVSRHPLLQRLEADGLCAPGPLGLGVATASTGQVLDRAGRQTGMYTLGPLRRGDLWETTAVPEIRDQAYELAGELARRLGPPSLERRLQSLV
jgi:uncharacterized NAD(P)/FAD-binding protein YdhS